MRRFGPRSRACAMLGALAFANVCGIAPVARASAGGDLALGEYLAAQCTSCHQLSGRQQGGIPAIIGWPNAFFIDAIDEYRTRKRGNAVMQTIAGGLSPEEIAALAAYFGGLKQTP